jgi:hypothetical protein
MSGDTKRQTTDSLGRKISFRKLNALDRMRIFSVLGSTLTENAGYLGYALSAACVTAIDDTLIPFPASRTTVENTVSQLGDEGIDAVTSAYRENFSPPTDDSLDEIKN